METEMTEVHEVLRVIEALNDQIRGSEQPRACHCRLLSFSDFDPPPIVFIEAEVEYSKGFFGYIFEGT
jgi:hypothetical protein